MLNKAQTLLLSLVETKNGSIRATYKAPHAYQPTPPRPHYPRKLQLKKKRLFKGHRP